MFNALLPCDVATQLLNKWLSLRDIVRLDSAICNMVERVAFFQCLHNHCFQTSIRVTDKSVKWLQNRHVMAAHPVFDMQEAASKFLRCSPNIQFVTCVSNVALDVVIAHCRHLRSFACDELTGTIPAHFLECLWNNQNSLEILQLDNVKCVKESPSVVVSPVCLKKLRSVSFKNADINTSILQILYECSCLEKLDVSGCAAFKRGIEGFLQKCGAQLRSVGLGGEPLSFSSFDSLAQFCPNIVNLQFSHHPAITDANLKTVLTALRQLKHLDISYCKRLTDMALVHVTEYIAPTVCALRACGFNIRVGIFTNLLATCSQLTELSVDCALGKYSGDVTPHMHRLTTFYFAGTMTETLLVDIVRYCSQLEVLVCKDERYTYRDVTDTPVVGLTDLRVMWAGTKGKLTRYSEIGLLALRQGLPNLQVLSLYESTTNNSLSKFAAQILLETHPKLLKIEESVTFVPPSVLDLPI